MRTPITCPGMIVALGTQLRFGVTANGPYPGQAAVGFHLVGA